MIAAALYFAVAPCIRFGIVGIERRTARNGCPTQDWPSRLLDQFVGGEEVVDFEGGSVGGVGAVGAVVADAGAEIAANGAGGSFLGVGGAHGIAPFGDGVFGFEDEGEDFAGGHKVGELGEERPLAMHGVEAAGLVFGEPHGFYGDDFEAGFVDAR